MLPLPGVFAPPAFAPRVPKAAIRTRLYLLMAALDVGGVIAGIAIAARLRDGAFLNANATEMLAALVPLYLILALYNRAFGIACLESGWHSVRRALLTLMVTAAITLGMSFALKISADYSRIVVASGLVGAAIWITGMRLAVDRLARRMLTDGPIDALALCDGSADLPPNAHRIDAALAGLRPDLDCPVMLERISRVLGAADRVTIHCPPERRAAWAAATKGIGVTVEVPIPEVEALGVLATQERGGRLTAVVARGSLGVRDRILKRAFDLAVTLTLLPIALVAALLIALAIKLDDGGPVFFVQPRIGQGNRPFAMLKFRSMRAGDPLGAVSATRGDVRLTRVGAFLRAWSLDELPQFLNILKGEMSIVGPRPHALGSTAEDALFWDIDRRYWFRHAAKPGLTGLAQVRGLRGATASAGDLADRIQADLEYLANWSLWRDLQIVLLTARVLRHPNAY